MRLLKFDAFYPLNYLKNKQFELKNDIVTYNYSEYYDWLMSQRCYLSDFFTYPMNSNGWNAKEFITHDDVLIRKLIKENLIKNKFSVEGLNYFGHKVSNLQLKDFIDFKIIQKIKLDRYYYIENYIKSFNPDILFLREPTQLDGAFFDRYRKKKFIVSLIGCRTTSVLNWDVSRSNLILTILPEYRDFFSLQGVDSILFEYGVDSRLFSEATQPEKEYDCVFVGQLGDPVQKMKSETMDFLSKNNRLLWWGVKGREIDKYPNLLRTWQGQTSGIDMYKIYSKAKIVINDYAEVANGSNVNMRTKEVWSVGGFLLTRKPKNITEITGPKICEYYVDHNDCLEKIDYYLKNEEERERIAKNGREHALKYYNYNDIIRDLMEKITESYSDWKKRYH